MNVNNPFTFKLIEVELERIKPHNQEVEEQYGNELMTRITAEALNAPIYINEGYFLLDGMHRLEAYKRLGKSTIECKMVTCANEELFFAVMERQYPFAKVNNIWRRK